MRKITSMREMQLIELDILLMFDQYCKDHSLRYSVYGGTLLGAARHKGFIPWDDDIDLCMERPQYELLIQTVRKHPLPPKYKLYSVQDKGYAKPFIKIINTGTKLAQKEKDDCSGVWIDIFPIDGTPKSELRCLMLVKRMTFLEGLLQTAASSPLQASSLPNKLAKCLLFPIARLWGANNICRRMDALAKRIPYEKSVFVGNIVWNRAGLTTRQYRNLFDGYGEIEFEGHQVSVQNNYLAVLYSLYGNFWLLPPESSRKKHGVEAFVLE